MSGKLRPYDLGYAIRRLPEELRDCCKKHGRKIVVAGGYIRSIVSGEDVSDIDILVGDVAFAEQLANALAASMAVKIYKSDNAFSIKCRPMIQVVHRWTFDDPARVLDSFDFTIASAAVWYENDGWHSLCHDDFYPDLAAKRLRYLKPSRNEDAGGSILRVLKFYQRGYRIPLDSFGAVIARIVSGVDLSAIEYGKEETIEQQWAKVLTGLLREVDPNSIRPYFEDSDKTEPNDDEVAIAPHSHL